MHLSSASEKSFMVRFVRSSRDSNEGERNYLTIYYMYVAHETSNGLTQLHFLSVNWGMTSSIILSHFSHKEQLFHCHRYKQALQVIIWPEIQTTLYDIVTQM